MNLNKPWQLKLGFNTLNTLNNKWIKEEINIEKENI